MRQRSYISTWTNGDDVGTYDQILADFADALAYAENLCVSDAAQDADVCSHDISEAFNWIMRTMPAPDRARDSARQP